MPHVIQEAERERILRSILAVSSDKPIGYLPLSTITSILGLDPAELAAQARLRSLPAVVLQPDRCINSGALYIYDHAALRLLLSRAERQVLSSGLSIQPDEFIEQVAATWFELNHPILPIIRAAFGDIR